jgi:hypothetical protein
MLVHLVGRPCRVIWMLVHLGRARRAQRGILSRHRTGNLIIARIMGSWWMEVVRCSPIVPTPGGG